MQVGVLHLPVIQTFYVWHSMVPREASNNLKHFDLLKVLPQ